MAGPRIPYRCHACDAELTAHLSAVGSPGTCKKCKSEHIIPRSGCYERIEVPRGTVVQTLVETAGPWKLKLKSRQKIFFVNLSLPLEREQ